MLMCVCEGGTPSTQFGIADFVNGVYNFGGQILDVEDVIDNPAAVTPFGLLYIDESVNLLGAFADALLSLDFVVRIRATIVETGETLWLLSVDKSANVTEFAWLQTDDSGIKATDGASGFPDREALDDSPSLTPGNHTVVWVRRAAVSAISKDGEEVVATETELPTADCDDVSFAFNGGAIYVRSLEILTNLAADEIASFSTETDPTTAPENDDFADAIEVELDEVVYGHLFLATAEVDEPVYPGFPGGTSVWYTFTAPSNGDFTVSLNGPATGIDPNSMLISIFTGDAVDDLTTVAINEVEPFDEVTFTATMGTVYRISIDAWEDGYGGPFQMTISAA